MKIITENIGEDGAVLTGYLHEYSVSMPGRKERPCIIICPGGGYEMLSDRENEPAAMYFYAKGYQVFVLCYTLAELAADLRPLMQISMAVMKIREQAKTWGAAAHKIAVMGFSAGGHVAASLGVLWDSQELKEILNTKDGQNKPNAMVLSYPVISGGKYAHEGSIKYVSGGKPKMKKLFSLDKHVSNKTVPTFIWHTVNDPSVPVENTLKFIKALQKKSISFECHIFPDGEHGLSMCSQEVNTPNARCAEWAELCSKWLSDLFSFEY